MDCEEITQLPVALTIMQTAEDRRLEKLFSCIYTKFSSTFLLWILSKYGNRSKSKTELLQDAKDAFQNGLMTFYEKSKKNELVIRGSLKTTVYSFGLLQLLAFYKKDRNVHGQTDYFLDCIDALLDDEISENERQLFLNERENILMEALKKLPEKERRILEMKFFKHLRSKEIAEILKVTPGNVDNEATKAYKKLRDIMVTKSGFQKQTNGAYR